MVGFFGLEQLAVEQQVRHVPGILGAVSWYNLLFIK